MALEKAAPARPKGKRKTTKISENILEEIFFYNFSEFKKFSFFRFKSLVLDRDWVLSGWRRDGVGLASGSCRVRAARLVSGSHFASAGLFLWPAVSLGPFGLLFAWLPGERFPLRRPRGLARLGSALLGRSAAAIGGRFRPEKGIELAGSLQKWHTQNARIKTADSQNKRVPKTRFFLA